MRHLPRAFILFCLIGVAGCSTVHSLESYTGEYHAWVRGRLKTERLYDNGRMDLVLKVLAGDSDLKGWQERISPGFSFNYRADRRQVLAAVNTMTTPDFTLNGRKPEHVAEIGNPALVERLYAFAYPFYRVYELTFVLPVDGAKTEKIEVRTARGALSTELEF